MADERRLIEWVLSGKDEATSVFERVSSSLEGVRGHFESIKDLLVAGLGFEVLNEAVGGAENLASGLLTANMNAETMLNTLKSVYGSATEASQAFAFLQSNEQFQPFDLQSIQQSALTLASVGDNITTVLPALETVAAVMGQSLPTAAQALMDSQEGLWRMMNRDLHVTKQELEQFGLQVDSAGSVVQNTLLPAFIKFAQTRFPDGTTNAMHTLAGEMSSLHTQFYLLQQEMGKDIFSAVKDQIFALTTFMQQNRSEIAAYAAAFGRGLADVGSAVFETVRLVGSVLPNALHIAGEAFGAIGAAGQAGWHLAEQAISTFAVWFQGNALPLIYTAVGAISGFWETHAQDVRTILGGLGADVQTFGTYLATNLANAMQVLEGIWNIGWGTITAIGGGAIALFSGNFGQFGRDIDVGTNQIMKGVIQGFGGILAYVATWAVELVGLGSTIMVPVANAMMAPWTKLAQGVRTVFEGIGAFLGDFVGVIAKVAADVDSKIAGMLNSAIDLIKKAQSILPERLQIDAIRNYKDIGLKESSDQVAQDTAKSISDWFKRNAPGIDPNQQITAGVSQDQARANIAAASQAILAPVLADIRQTTDALLKQYGLTDAQTGIGFGGGGPTQQKGQQQVDDFGAWLKKLLQGGPNLPAIPGGAAGQLPGPGGLPVPGMAGGADPKSVTAALKAAYDQARVQFQLDEKNGVSVTKLLQDVQAISLSQEKEGTAHTQILLDQKNNLDSIVSTEIARLTFDQNHSATLATLLADIKNIALAERAAGYSPAAIAADVKKLTAQVLPASADPNAMLNAMKDHLTRLENQGAGTSAIATFEMSMEKFMTANQGGLKLSNDQLYNAIHDLRQSIHQGGNGPQGLTLTGMPSGQTPAWLDASRGEALFRLGIARQGESQQLAVLQAQLDQARQMNAYLLSALRATESGNRFLQLSSGYLHTIASRSKGGEQSKQGAATGYRAGA